MAALPTQALSTPPVVYAAAESGGDTFVWATGTFLHLKNSSANDRTVTVEGQVPCSQGFLHNAAYVVPTVGELFVPPVDGSFQDEDGLIHLTYSAITGLTLAALIAS